MGNQLSNVTGKATRPKLKPEEVSGLPLVPHITYATLCEHVYNEPDRRPIPKGWRALMSCDEVHLDKEGYYATAYINEEIKHCIIAERGTSDALGIRAGVWMYFDEPTIQFALAEQFSKLVRLRLSLIKTSIPSRSLNVASSSGPYVISYTGHSLGAVLAACRACAEHTYAITFESPGCRQFVEKTMHPFRADDADIITYLRPPNPINTLKPQCGYLVQLPYVGPPPGVKKPPVKTSFAASLPNPQDYLRSKLLEKSIPELGQYLSKVEPIIKELVEHTQQVHSIANIVSDFERGENPEPSNQDVVLQWPSHIMQFLEYFNITRAMEDPANQHTHAYNAYQTLLDKLYRTSKRPIYKMPLRFLRRDSQTLVKLWCILPVAQLNDFPVTALERKALNTIVVEADTFSSNVLTAFQVKQLLSLITQRPEIHNVLDSFPDVAGMSRSKL